MNWKFAVVIFHALRLEVLYAKNPLIIDTKEKFRQRSENQYLKKNPYKSKIRETLDLYVSENMLDRALSIFDTIIKGLIFRGHSIKCKDNQTYAIVDGEEIQIRLTERKSKILIAVIAVITIIISFLANYSFIFIIVRAFIAQH